ncbi:MAG TPA: hypothetical protein VGK72_05895 [Chthoniobacterales bacterium]|jgi:hypothetical protein
MDKQLQEDWLDARLREEMPYIDDEGFTARVVQKLPAARPRSFRAAILIGLTVVASVIAYLLSDGGRFLVVEAYRLMSMPLVFVSVIAIVLSVAITGIAAAAAFSTVRQRH